MGSMALYVDRNLGTCFGSIGVSAGARCNGGAVISPGQLVNYINNNIHKKLLDCLLVVDDDSSIKNNVERDVTGFRSIQDVPYAYYINYYCLFANYIVIY
jgi:hypothetical protein